MLNTQRRLNKLDARACLIALWGLSVLALSNCIANPDKLNQQAQTELIEAFRAQSEEARTEATTRYGQIFVKESVRGKGLTLSADLHRAERDRVMREILEDPRILFQSDVAYFPGQVSTRFRDYPLMDGLNTLLSGTQLKAVEKDSLVTFERRSAEPRPLTSEDNKLLDREEVVLHHLAAADAEQLLLDLYSSENDESEGMLTVGSLPELNAVFVAGPSDKVTEAVSVLASADRPVAHVIIEALVVRINTSSVEELGLRLSDGASGHFSAIDILPSQTGGNIVATFSDLAANSAQVTATIEFLAAQNVAKVLARPYIATRSTKSAQIEIVNDQFARVNTTNDDASIIGTDSVTAGVTMSITPAVMAGDGIRLDLQIEDSRFGLAAGDVIITKDRNTATSSMIVKSGQTIVIGGLNSNYRIVENTGPPWLRRVPGLNLLFGNQAAIDVRNELVVYITPYIWVPSLDVPLPLPGTPSADMGEWISLEGVGP